MPPRFFTPRSSVQNDMNINSFLTATSYESSRPGQTPAACPCGRPGPGRRPLRPPGVGDFDEVGDGAAADVEFPGLSGEALPHLRGGMEGEIHIEGHRHGAVGVQAAWKASSIKAKTAVPCTIPRMLAISGRQVIPTRARPGPKSSSSRLPEAADPLGRHPLLESRSERFHQLWSFSSPRELLGFRVSVFRFSSSVFDLPALAES